MNKLGDKNAFPDGGICGGGMTLREYFAGLAMQGLMARTDMVTVPNGTQMTTRAQIAVNAADTLLEALEAK